MSKHLKLFQHFECAKYKGKKRTKSKQDRDIVQTTRFISRNSVDNDKDETSSTTTESSVGEDNDKSSSARESTPEPVPTIKAKKMKSKARTVEAVGHYDDTYDDNDFELTSKSKAHKKIKVNSKDAYGGNILRPSTLELPYSLETKQDKDKKEKSILDNSTSKAEKIDFMHVFLTCKCIKSDPSKNLVSIQNMTRNNVQSCYFLTQLLMKKTKLLIYMLILGKNNGFIFYQNFYYFTIASLLFISTTTTTLDSTELLSDQSQDLSPTPAWDQPSPALPLPGDLSELSIQTQEFAQKQAKAVNGFSPDLLTSSSRSSSYSSIVSNSSGDGTNGKNKVKSGVENKRFPIGFSPFGDSALPAAIGTKAKSAPVGAGKSRNVWNVSPPTTPDAAMNSFGLQTIQESHRSGSTSQPDSPVDVFTQPKLNFSPPHENVYNFVGGNGNAVTANQTSGNFEPAQTMMQRLQADRRKRIMEHQMRMMNGEDWPGFDVPPVRSDSLWDSEYNPLDPVNKWSQLGVAPPTSSSESLWSSLANSANSSWNSLMSIWGSNTPMTTGAETMTTDSGFNVENGDNTSGNAPQSPDQLGTFNPFNSMADIWGPNATTTSSGWTFQTPKTDDN
ncbi:hypothetical protein KUTeg_023929 [Tegillarca granosa]|uniref:Uncharacterized protein n=1 Tax=Tegillarca granosa TaxID=220873 RepID=A0ABQ9DVU6_TEGGR|nr:hypothetical protein KUTeg_023929 [Tegillarca granosa]